jgi:hypothetical protein
MSYHHIVIVELLMLQGAILIQQQQQLQAIIHTQLPILVTPIHKPPSTMTLTIVARIHQVSAVIQQEHALGQI